MLHENLEAWVKLRSREISGGVIDWTERYPLIFESVGIPNGKILDIGSYDTRLATWFGSMGINRTVISLDARDLRGLSHPFLRGSAQA